MAAQHSTAQHSTAQHSTAQHSTAQHSTAYITLLSYLLTASAPAYSQSSLLVSLSSESTSYHSSILEGLSGYSVYKDDARSPLWVNKSASMFSSWQEASQQTGSPLADLLRINQASADSELPDGNIWVHAPKSASYHSELPSLGGGDGQSPDDSLTKNQVASELSVAGRVIDENGTGAYIEQLGERVKDYGNSAIEDGVMDLLSSYGTVKFSTDLLTNLDDPSASLNALFPLYDNSHQLVFTQFGYQYNSESHFSGRDFLNVGLGFRVRNNDYLFGGNAFYDVDMSRGHRRGSVGMEYFKDYLKVTGNYYFPLSDWKDSSDLSYYLERPARGGDLKVTGYLPMYPQIGASLEYGQYFGEEVDISGSQHREKNPYSVTIEGEYTPVPAIRLHMGVTEAKGQSSVEAGADFTYRLGVPWKNQLSPAYVAKSRQLSWLWHDLVDRNNNIVLEYKKKDVFTASVQSSVVQMLNADHHYQPLSLGVTINGHQYEAGAIPAEYDIQWKLPLQLLPVITKQKIQSSHQTMQVLVPPFKGSYPYDAVITHRETKKTKTVHGVVTVDSSPQLEKLILVPDRPVDFSHESVKFAVHFIPMNAELGKGWDNYWQQVEALPTQQSLHKEQVVLTSSLPHLTPPKIDHLTEEITLATDDKSSLIHVGATRVELKGVYQLGDKSLTIPISLKGRVKIVPHAAITATVGDSGVTAAATGGNGTLTYAVTPANLASIDAATGALTLKLPGTATVTVTDPGDAKHASQTATTSVTIAKAAGSQAGGHPITPHAAITATVGDSGVTAAATGGNGTLTYAVTPANLASIDAATGALTLKLPGTATVTVTDPGDAKHASQTATTSVTIAKAAGSLKAPYQEFTLNSYFVWSRLNQWDYFPGNIAEVGDYVTIASSWRYKPQNAGITSVYWVNKWYLDGKLVLTNDTGYQVKPADTGKVLYAESTIFNSHSKAQGTTLITGKMLIK